MIVLNATLHGAAQRLPGAVPEPRITPIHDDFRPAGSTQIVAGPGAESESAPFGAGEPTF
jgi:hypothetical protein